jgi:hypothetical protein
LLNNAFEKFDCGVKKVLCGSGVWGLMEVVAGCALVVLLFMQMMLELIETK